MRITCRRRLFSLKVSRTPENNVSIVFYLCGLCIVGMHTDTDGDHYSLSISRKIMKALELKTFKLAEKEISNVCNRNERTAKMHLRITGVSCAESVGASSLQQMKLNTQAHHTEV